MDNIVGNAVVGSRGAYWKYDDQTKSYYPDEHAPPLSPNYSKYSGLFLTDMGHIWNEEKKIILEFFSGDEPLPPLKQFDSSDNMPILFGLTRENKLVRISQRSKTWEIVKEDIIYLLDYEIRYKYREGLTITGAILDVVDADGFKWGLTLNKNLDIITKEENLGYFSNEIYEKKNDFLYTADGVFDIDQDGVITKLNNFPPGIVDGLIRLSEDEVIEFIVLLDDKGQLWYTNYDSGDRLDQLEFTPCENEYIIERNETDQWYKMVNVEKYGYMGIVGLSGRLSLVNHRLSVESTKLQPEIFRQIPTQSKSARNKA